jgi:hypothetical protein
MKALPCLTDRRNSFPLAPLGAALDIIAADGGVR